jgi:hypothetical protein
MTHSSSSSNSSSSNSSSISSSSCSKMRMTRQHHLQGVCQRLHNGQYTTCSCSCNRSDCGSAVCQHAHICLLCVSVITDAHDGTERAQASAASAHFTAHCTDRKLVGAFGCWLLCCAVCTAGTKTPPHLVRSLPSHHQGLRPEAPVLPLLLLLQMLLL